MVEESQINEIPNDAGSSPESPAAEPPTEPQLGDILVDAPTEIDVVPDQPDVILENTSEDLPPTEVASSEQPPAPDAQSVSDQDNESTSQPPIEDLSSDQLVDELVAAGLAEESAREDLLKEDLNELQESVRQAREIQTLEAAVAEQGQPGASAEQLAGVSGSTPNSPEAQMESMVAALSNYSGPVQELAKQAIVQNLVDAGMIGLLIPAQKDNESPEAYQARIQPILQRNQEVRAEFTGKDLSDLQKDLAVMHAAAPEVLVKNLNQLQLAQNVVVGQLKDQGMIPADATQEQINQALVAEGAQGQLMMALQLDEAALQALNQNYGGAEVPSAAEITKPDFTDFREYADSPSLSEADRKLAEAKWLGTEEDGTYRIQRTKENGEVEFFDMVGLVPGALQARIRGELVEQKMAELGLESGWLSKEDLATIEGQATSRMKEELKEFRGLSVQNAISRLFDGPTAAEPSAESKEYFKKLMDALDKTGISGRLKEQLKDGSFDDFISNFIGRGAEGKPYSSYGAKEGEQGEKITAEQILRQLQDPSNREVYSSEKLTKALQEIYGSKGLNRLSGINFDGIKNNPGQVGQAINTLLRQLQADLDGSVKKGFSSGLLEFYNQQAGKTTTSIVELELRQVIEELQKISADPDKKIQSTTQSRNGDTSSQTGRSSRNVTPFPATRSTSSSTSSALAEAA